MPLMEMNICKHGKLGSMKRLAGERMERDLAQRLGLDHVMQEVSGESRAVLDQLSAHDFRVRERGEHEAQTQRVVQIAQRGLECRVSGKEFSSRATSPRLSNTIQPGSLQGIHGSRDVAIVRVALSNVSCSPFLDNLVQLVLRSCGVQSLHLIFLSFRLRMSQFAKKDLQRGITKNG